jgi:hypothetical protein
MPRGSKRENKVRQTHYQSHSRDKPTPTILVSQVAAWKSNDSHGNPVSKPNQPQCQTSSAQKLHKILEVWDGHLKSQIHYNPTYDKDSIVAADKRELPPQNVAQTHTVFTFLGLNKENADIRL